MIAPPKRAAILGANGSAPTRLRRAFDAVERARTPGQSQLRQRRDEVTSPNKSRDRLVANRSARCRDGPLASTAAAPWRLRRVHEIFVGVELLVRVDKELNPKCMSFDGMRDLAGGRVDQRTKLRSGERRIRFIKHEDRLFSYSLARRDLACMTTA